MKRPRLPSSAPLIRPTRKLNSVLYTDLPNAAHTAGASVGRSGISVVEPRTSIVRIVSAFRTAASGHSHSRATAASISALPGATWQPSPSLAKSRFPTERIPPTSAITPSTSASEKPRPENEASSCAKSSSSLIPATS